ncbi:hypothetical protein [Listeria booriae]|uniref:hypothetical protein n=1 Tax=Listeria booriae TaxID=1552123 RepID=UPI001623E954|nr:hypothetical protein [Listeria booriae]MBC1228588.1 hypothetical protein [Listeria booriae]
MKKTSEAQLAADKRFREKHREKTRLKGYARTARMFIRSHATGEDLEELKDLIQNREEELKMEEQMTKLEEVLTEFGFGHVILEELDEYGEAKVSMELDETPDLMDAINERTAYVAELHPSTDFIVISKG